MSRVLWEEGRDKGGLFGQAFSMPNRRRALSKPQANGHRQAFSEDRGLPNSKKNERWVGVSLLYWRCMSVRLVWWAGIDLASGILGRSGCSNKQM